MLMEVQTDKQTHGIRIPISRHACGRRDKNLLCMNRRKTGSLYLAMPEARTTQIFSRTAWLRCLILDTQHCLVVFYQVCSNDSPRVQNGPGPGVLGLNHRNT